MEVSVFLLASGVQNWTQLGRTTPLENFDEAQRLLQPPPAQPHEQAVHLLARRLVRGAAGALRRGHAGAAGPGRGAGAAGTVVGLRTADPRRGNWEVPELQRPSAARDPGWLGGSRGALLLALSEAAAAALPGRLQKAPESNSNFCQTREPTWQPSHVARAREPSSRPLSSLVPARGTP